MATSELTAKELQLKVESLTMQLATANKRIDAARIYAEDQLSGFEEDYALDQRWSIVTFILDGTYPV